MLVAEQSQGASRREPEEKKREARAQCILDAASALILRYGYHKTTIDDIAREAGVGKGTLYLHWKTREELFKALITREKVAMAEDIGRRIAGDPAGATLPGLLMHAALALMRRPLLKAVLLRDTEVFGKLVEREQSSATTAEVIAGFTAYFQALRDKKLVRMDLSLHEQVVIFSAIFLGFLLSVPFLPDAFKPSDERLAELMAETGHRALEPRDPGSPDALQSASHTLAQYLDHSVARAQGQLYGEERTEVEESPVRVQPEVRARGRKGGRTKKLATAAKMAEVRHLYADKSKSIEEICAVLGISRASLYRYIKDAQQEGE